MSKHQKIWDPLKIDEINLKYQATIESNKKTYNKLMTIPKLNKKAKKSPINLKWSKTTR